MNNVPIEKIHDLKQSPPPMLEEMQKTFDEVRQRAFGLFQQRRTVPGANLDDWFRAERELLGPSPSELTESARHYVLRIAVPGLDPKDLRVAATSRTILVQGTSAQRHGGGNAKLCFCEFGEKLFRRFDLTDQVDLDKVSATVEKGVLRIVAQKEQETKERPSSVQARVQAGMHA